MSLSKLEQLSREFKDLVSKLNRNVMTSGGSVKMGHRNLPDMPSASNADHDGRYYTETEHISATTGIADKGKPIVLDSLGYLSPTMVRTSGLIAEASETISALKVVCTTSLGRAMIATCDDTSFANSFYGIAYTAADEDEDITIVTSGYISDSSWHWNILKPIFLGVNGVLTQTAPTTGFRQIIGYPLSYTSMFVRPSDSIIKA